MPSIVRIVSAILFLWFSLMFSSPSFAAVETDILPAPNQEGKWGYVNARTKKTVIAPRYSEAEFFEDGIARIRYAYRDKAKRAITQTGKHVLLVPHGFGLIDRSGREILPPEYDRIEAAKATYGKKEKIPKLFRVTHGEKTGLFHADGHWPVPLGPYYDFQLDQNGDIRYGSCFLTKGKEYCAPSGYALEQISHETQTFIIKSKPSISGPRAGVIKWTGESVIAPDYHEIEAINNPVPRWVASRVDGSIAKKIWLAVVNKTDLDIDDKKDNITFDLLDENGQKIFSHRARYYPFVEKGKDRINYESEGKEYTISAVTGELISEPATRAVGKEYILFQENGYKGIKNTEGQIILPAIYFEIYSLGGDLFAASTQEGIDTSKPAPKYDRYYGMNYGVVNAAGHVIMPFEYRSIHRTNYPDEENSLLIVQTRSDSEEKGFGLADRTGRLLTPTQYLNAFYFNKKGQAGVYHAEKGHGVIDYTGKEILPLEFRSIFDTSKLDKTEDILYIVKKDKKWGLYDMQGKELLPIKYGYISISKEDAKTGWMRIEDEERHQYGAYNYLTKVNIPPAYSSVQFYPGLIVGRYQSEKNKDNYILLDQKGKIIKRYDQIQEAGYKSGYLLLTQNGLVSLLDPEGKTIIPFKYKQIRPSESPSYWWASDSNDRQVLVGKNGEEYRIEN